MEIVRVDGKIEVIKYDKHISLDLKGNPILDEKGNKIYIPSKYRSCIIDTISAPQNEAYRTINKGKMTTVHEWKDYGWEVYDLYNTIKRLPDTKIVQILGLEGTGKTVGGKYLDPDTNAWINADGKPLTFMGARQMYPEDKSRKNYSEAETYDEILKNIVALHAKRKGTFIVFILGHTDMYKGANELIYQRLRVLGKQATKLGIEGLNVFATYYTKIKPGLPANDSTRYQLAVSSSGYDTARTPEGYHNEPEIPNNYQIIVDKILEDYGELKVK